MIKLNNFFLLPDAMSTFAILFLTYTPHYCFYIIEMKTSFQKWTINSAEGSREGLLKRFISDGYILYI